MKTIVVTKRNQHGSSVLLITIGTTFLIGISLAGYLIMAQKQNISVARSQTWNSSIALAESGVEDAMAMLNRNGGNFDTLFNWTNSSALTADHWDTVAANIYHTRRYVGSNYYDAYITNLSTGTPNLSSIGTVAWGYHSRPNGSEWLMAATGVNPPPPATITRKLEVRTRVDPLFNVAMAAVNTIDFNGKRVGTDSFDSSDPAYCDPGGLYPTNINKTKAGGDVVTDDTVIGALDVGNAKIKGVVKTGPKGAIDIGDNGSVGDRAWVEGGRTGVQPGHATDDMNVLFEPVVLPIGATTWLAPSLLQQNIPIGATTYTYAFTAPTTQNYKLTSLGGKIYVGAGATVRLYVTGAASFSGQDRVDIMLGGTLKIYMGGNFSDTGQGFLNNYNQNAANFYLYGLSTCTDINIGGNAAFTGVIYAPQADLHLGGGGSTDYDFVGSTITKSVQMNGHFKFHYDEALRAKGPAKGYTPTNWKEVKN